MDKKILMACSIRTSTDLIEGPNAFPVESIVFVSDDIIPNGECVMIPKEEFINYLKTYPRKVGI